MNKFVFIGIVALVLGTAAVLVASGEKEELSATSSGSSQATSKQQQQVEAILSQYTGTNGTYTRHDTVSLHGALADSGESEKNILFFEGRTCPTCKELDKNIRAVDIPDSVNIYNILAEDNPGLMRKYQVRSTPGLYQVDSGGNLIKQLQPVIQLDNILLQLI